MFLGKQTVGLPEQDTAKQDKKMPTENRNPYVWTMSVAVAAVFLKQASVWFPMVNTAGPSKVVKINRNTDTTGQVQQLVTETLSVDWWSWEYICWPMMVELNGRSDLLALYGRNGLALAEYLYPLLYSRLAAQGKVP